MHLLNLSGTLSPLASIAKKLPFFFLSQATISFLLSTISVAFLQFFLRKILHEDFILFANCYSPANLRPVNRCLNIQFFVATFVLKSTRNSRIRNSKNANLGAYN